MGNWGYNPHKGSYNPTYNDRRGPPCTTMHHHAILLYFSAMDSAFAFPCALPENLPNIKRLITDLPIIFPLKAIKKKTHRKQRYSIHSWGKFVGKDQVWKDICFLLKFVAVKFCQLQLHKLEIA